MSSWEWDDTLASSESESESDETSSNDQRQKNRSKGSDQNLTSDSQSQSQKPVEIRSTVPLTSQPKSRSDVPTRAAATNEEEEVFEIEDYSTATEWEVLISQIETQLRSWQKSSLFLSSGSALFPPDQSLQRPLSSSGSSSSSFTGPPPLTSSDHGAPKNGDAIGNSRLKVTSSKDIHRHTFLNFGPYMLLLSLHAFKSCVPHRPQRNLLGPPFPSQKDQMPPLHFSPEWMEYCRGTTSSLVSPSPAQSSASAIPTGSGSDARNSSFMSPYNALRHIQNSFGVNSFVTLLPFEKCNPQPSSSLLSMQTPKLFEPESYFSFLYCSVNLSSLLLSSLAIALSNNKMYDWIGFTNLAEPSRLEFIGRGLQQTASDHQGAIPLDARGILWRSDGPSQLISELSAVIDRGRAALVKLFCQKLPLELSRNRLQSLSQANGHSFDSVKDLNFNIHSNYYFVSSTAERKERFILSNSAAMASARAMSDVDFGASEDWIEFEGAEEFIFCSEFEPGVFWGTDEDPFSSFEIAFGWDQRWSGSKLKELAADIPKFLLAPCWNLKTSDQYSTAGTASFLNFYATTSLHNLAKWCVEAETFSTIADIIHGLTENQNASSAPKKQRGKRLLQNVRKRWGRLFNQRSLPSHREVRQFISRLFMENVAVVANEKIPSFPNSSLGRNQEDDRFSQPREEEAMRHDIDRESRDEDEYDEENDNDFVIYTNSLVSGFQQWQNPWIKTCSWPAAPEGSLFADFVLNLLRMGATTLAAGALLWENFTREIRRYWESATKIPRVDCEKIDLQSCLVFQKLQLLNYCINNHREKQQRAEEGDSVRPVVLVDAEGVQSTMSGAENCLLEYPGKPINIPQTMEFGMMTEDMIVEQQQVLATLAQTNDSRLLEFHHQQLVSDMSAFKAANPGCVIADFVRWHSPRDWIVDGTESASSGPVPSPLSSPLVTDTAAEERKQGDVGLSSSMRGHLSARMSGPDNVWRQLWEKCQPIPVSRQPPSFNCEKEAEKILHQLETIDPGHLFAQIFSVACSLMLRRFCCSNFVVCVPALGQQLVGAGQKLQRLFQGLNFMVEGLSLDFAAQALHCFLVVENLAVKTSSLVQKFPLEFRLANELLLHGQSDVETETEKKTVVDWFQAMQVLDHITDREFVIMTWAPATNPSPQRFYVRQNNVGGGSHQSIVCSLVLTDQE